MSDLIWTEKPRNFLKWAINFTRYELYPDRLIITAGFIVKQKEEILLYRILDKSSSATLIERALDLGTIYLRTQDPTRGFAVLQSIPHYQRVYKALDMLIAENRNKYGMQSREAYISMSS